MSSGGLPSKTYTGLMPASSIFAVRSMMPLSGPVFSPASFVIVSVPSLDCIAIRNCGERSASSVRQPASTSSIWAPPMTRKGRCKVKTI